jgi:hypothetical protein
MDHLMQRTFATLDGNESALLQHGIAHLQVVEQGLRDWMEVHEDESVRQM